MILKKLLKFQTRAQNKYTFFPDLYIAANVDPTRRYLYLQVLGGRAFLEHLQEPEPYPGQVTSTFSLHINFRGQRFKSRPTPCAVDPDIQEGFLLELHKDSAGTCLQIFKFDIDIRSFSSDWCYGQVDHLFALFYYLKQLLIDYGILYLKDEGMKRVLFYKLFI